MAQLQEGASPNRSIGFVGIDPEVMGFIGDGQEICACPAFEHFRQPLELAPSGLVRQQPAIGACEHIGVGRCRPVRQAEPQP